MTGQAFLRELGHGVFELTRAFGLAKQFLAQRAIDLGGIVQPLVQAVALVAERGQRGFQRTDALLQLAAAKDAGFTIELSSTP